MKKNKINCLSTSTNIIMPFAIACFFQYSQAFAKVDNYDFTKNWFFGINAIYSKTGFKNDYGDNTFSTKFNLGVNPFVRHMFNNNWGIEAGLDIYQNINRIVAYNQNDTMTGISVREIIRIIRISTTYPVNTFTNKTRIKQRNIYLGGIGNFAKNKSSLSLMLGVSLSNVNARSETFKTDLGDLTIPNRKILNYKKSKLIPIVRASLEYKLNPNLKLKGLAMWKWTSRFKVKSKEEYKIRNNSFGHGEIKLKDSLGLGLGFTYCM